MGEEERQRLSDQRWQCYEDKRIYTGLQLVERAAMPQYAAATLQKRKVGRRMVVVVESLEGTLTYKRIR